MNVQNEIVRELQEMQSPLAEMPRRMPYAVPEGYFSSFSINTNAQPSQAAIPLEEWPKQNPLSIPEGYFNSLPQEMLAMALSDEAAHPQKPPFTVPQDYFNEFPQRIVKKITSAPRRGIARWLSPVHLAAAAVMILGIGFATFTIVDPTAEKELTLADIPAQHVQEFVKQNIDDFDTELFVSNLSVSQVTQSAEDLNKQDIIHYLNETGWEGQTEFN